MSVWTQLAHAGVQATGHPILDVLHVLPARLVTECVALQAASHGVRIGATDRERMTKLAQINRLGRNHGRT